MPRIERSPADVLRLVVAAALWIALLLVEWLFGDTLIAFGSDLLRGLDALPKWLIDVVVVGTRILGVVVLGGGLVVDVVPAAVADARHRRARGAAGRGCSSLLGDLFGLDDGRDLVDVGDDLGPLGADGFPTAWGIGPWSRGAHVGGAVAEPSVAPGGLGVARRVSS